ncbi:MAG TPA: PKD domain-containing protein [Candidatus Anammoximicrobium sp.]|nr:PKD domain-containing protein [Candidatus Anammoximicrobium sp.]
MDSGDILTLSATLDDGSALPAWLTFQPGTGTFSGTPTEADVGASDVKVTATDTGNAAVSDTFRITVYDNQPVAVFTAHPNPCACGQIVTFDASDSYHTSPDHDIVIYEWDIDYDGTFEADGSGVTLTHTYAQFGQYTAALRVTDDGGLTDVATQVINVNLGNRAPVADADGPYVLAVGEDLVLNGSGSSDPDAGCGDSIVRYEWDFDRDGSYEYSGATPTVPWADLDERPQDGSPISIRLQVTDSFGLTHTDDTELRIYVNEPVALFTAHPNPSACGQIVTFDATSSYNAHPDYGIVQYEWDFDYDGTFDVDATGATVTHAYTQFGMYTAALRVTDDNTPAKTDLATQVINVNQGNRAPVADADGPYILAVGEDLVLDGSGSSDPDASCGDSIVRYEWDFDRDGSYEYSGATPTVPWADLDERPQDGSPISIRLQVTDSFGLTHTDDTELRIYVNEPVALFTAHPNPSACGQIVTFDATSSYNAHPDYGIVQYEWDFDYDGTFDVDATGATVTHAYTQFGMYTAALRVTDDNTPAKTDLATQVINVNLGNLPPVADADGPYPVPEGSGLTLNASGSTDPNTSCGDSIVSWEWDLDGMGDFDDGDGEQLELTPQAMENLGLGDGPVERTIRLRVTDSFGVSSTDETTIRVTNVPPVATAGSDVSSGFEPLEVKFTGAGSDIPADLPLTYFWSFGDGETSTEQNPTHTYRDNGTFTARLTVTDKDGDSDSATVPITVENELPVVAVPSVVLPFDEGTLFELPSVTFTDPGVEDTHTATIDWGDTSPVEDGTVVEPAGAQAGEVHGSHVYADDGTYTVTVTVEDDDGGVTTETITVTVQNVAPTINAGPDRTAKEGQLVSLAPATFHDAGTLDTHVATIDWGDGTVEAGVVTESPFGPPGSTLGMNGTIAGSHVYADDGTYRVTVSVRDDDMTDPDWWVESFFDVFVENVLPSDVEVTLSDATINEGDSVTLSGTFVDPGTLDTHVVTVNWGDGDSSTVELAAGVYAFTAVHTYIDNETGTEFSEFGVSVSVTDDDFLPAVSGDPGASNFQFRQLSWYDAAGNLVVPNSSWGMFTADVVGDPNQTMYLNVAAQTGQGSPVWIVQNMPIFADLTNEGGDFDISLLGLQEGAQLATLDYIATVDDHILTTMPTGTMTTAPVTALDYHPGGDLKLDQPAVTASVVGTPAGIMIGQLISSLIEHEGVPGVQEGDSQCLAGATARSIAWLNARYNLGSTKTPQQIYDDMQALNNSTATYAEFLAGKAAYLAAMAGATGATAETKILKVDITMPDDPAGVTVQTEGDVKQWIRDELNRGEDVELDYDTHIITVTGTFDVGGKTYLKYRDDEDQGDDDDGDTGTKIGELTQNGDGDWQFRRGESSSFWNVRLVMSESVYRSVVTVTNLPPEISVTNDGPVDEEEPVGVTITASDPAGVNDDPLTYEWDFDNDGTYDFSSTSSNVATHAYADGGTYTVGVRVTDHDGAWAASSTLVRVYQNEPFASFTADPNPAACGDTVTFDASSSHHGHPDHSIVRYEWDFDGDGTYDLASAAPTTTHAYPSFGTYTVTLRVTDDNVPPSMAESFFDVFVNQGNLPPVAEANGPYTIELGQDLPLSGSGSYDPNEACGDSIVKYEWDLDNDGAFDDAAGVAPVVPWAQLAALNLPANVLLPIRLRVTDTFDETGVDASTLFIQGNHPPTGLNLSPAAVAENLPAGTDVGTLTTVDVDLPDDSHTYSLVPGIGSADNGSFVIDGNQLKTAAMFDFETKASYAIRLRTTDREGLWHERTLTITVTDVNDPPQVSLTNPVISLPENAPTTPRIRVANIVVRDDALGNNVLSLAGDDAGMFEIGGNLLFLKAGAVLDFETNPKLEVAVVVDDPGLGTTPEDAATITITVTNVNDPPRIELTEAVTELPENTDTSAGLPVANLAILDDGLGTNLVSIGGADGAMFVIQGGQLRLRPGAVLDFETNPELEVIVTVNDETVGERPDDTASLTITVTDANDPPQVALVNTTTSLPEGPVATALKVADIVVTDQDARPEYRDNDLSLSGPDSGMFEIVGNSLYLKGGQTLNSATNPVLDVTVEVDDDTVGATPDATSDLAISVLRQGVQLEWRFDFNAGSGVTQPGYMGVPITKRYAGGGSDFGWSSSAAPLASFDRYGPDALRRDGHYGYDGTFQLDVPAPGPYVVTVVIGDTSPFYHDLLRVWAEGVPQLMVSTTAGQWSMPSFVVPVNDGTLTLRLENAGGVDPHYVINALRVRAQSLVRTLTVTPPSPSAPLDADGTTIDTYTVSGAKPNTLATVASSLGMVTGMDHDATIQGVQVPTGTGSFTFTVKRPSGVDPSPSDARITVQEVEGTGLGEAVQQFQSVADPGTVLRFDFEASNLMTQPGFTSVGPRDLYSATRGYGWSTRVAAADRASSGMSPLNRDLHTGSNATFKVNVQSAPTYYVRVYLSNPLGTGGYRYTYDNFDVKAEDQTFHVDNLEPGIVTVHTFVVKMAAGDTVLDVQFVDRGGQNFNWVVSGMDIWTTMDPGQQGLLAEAARTPAATGAALSAEALAPVVAEASAWWSGTGLTAAQSAALAQVQFQVADLGGAYLGLADTAMGVVRIDDDAAGWGWSVIGDQWSVVSGPSSLHNGQRTDDKGQMADDGFDLRHVVLHELGHVLGYGHSADADDLMAPVLSPLASSALVPHPASRISDPFSDLDAVWADWSAGEPLRLDSDHSEFAHAASGARRTEDEDELWVPRRLRSSPYEEAVDAFLADWEGGLE